jgi:hypothetical protein
VRHISDLLAEVVEKLAQQHNYQLNSKQEGEPMKKAKHKKHEETHDKFRLCPRCENFIPNNATPGAYPGAISRLDNITEICSDCGGEEAVLQWQNRLTDWRKKSK